MGKDMNKRRTVSIGDFTDFVCENILASESNKKALIVRTAVIAEAISYEVRIMTYGSHSYYTNSLSDAIKHYNQY